MLCCGHGGVAKLHAFMHGCVRTCMWAAVAIQSLLLLKELPFCRTDHIRTQAPFLMLQSSSDSSPTDGKPQNGSSHYPISKAPVTCPEVHGNILEVLAAVASYPELARVLLGEPALPASLAEASERDSVQERFSGAGLDTQQAAHGSGSGSGHSPNQQQSTTADQGGSVAPDHAVSGDAAASGKQQQHPWQPRLMRMLLNFFTAPPPPPPPPPVVATPPEQPVPLPAVVEPAKAAGPASRSSGGGGAAAKGAKKPAAAEPAAAPATTSTSHAAKDAEKGKVCLAVKALDTEHWGANGAIGQFCARLQMQLASWYYAHVAEMCLWCCGSMLLVAHLL